VQAAFFGKAVALVEMGHVLGGAAADTGTLPSKTLRESALYLSGFKKRELFGFTFAAKDRVTARDFMYRERAVVEAEHARIADSLRRHKVRVLRGFASLRAHHPCRVGPRGGT
jgi:NAD(P) transhydrogenase